LRERAADPWDGATLEWSTSSPPPEFNFAHLPQVTSAEPWWDIKRREAARQGLLNFAAHYEPLEIPRNSATGFVCAFFAVITGFSLIWHIWWLVVAGLVGAYATFVVLAWRDVHEHVLPAEEVARLDRASRENMLAALAGEVAP
jgi:cytochrome o ubiquinol oxidase subunit 1